MTGHTTAMQIQSNSFDVIGKPCLLEATVASL
jgi:hypothetical protein